MREASPGQLSCQHGISLDHCSICQGTDHSLRQNIDLALLYEEARPRLLRLASSQGITADMSDDIVQETFIEAWKHLEQLRQPERLSAWLDGICRNVCKRQRASSFHEAQYTISNAESPMDEWNLPDPQTIDLDEDLERQDKQILLDRALGYLSGNVREVIELCYLAELPQREVAQRLRISQGALELKLHRARRQLRQILNSELRADASAFGLLLNEDESMSWHETRHWCWLCGKHYMRGIFERQASGIVSLRLRCPVCSQRHQTDITNSGNITSLANIHSFLPAIKRTFQAVINYFVTAVEKHTCSICQATIQLHIIPRDTRNAISFWDMSHPYRTFISIDCPNCGPTYADLVSILLAHPQVIAFMLEHRRPISEPDTTVTYAGQEVFCSRLIDLQSQEQISILAHPETLHILAVLAE